jgi:hypothetical protein
VAGHRWRQIQDGKQATPLPRNPRGRGLAQEGDLRNRRHESSRRRIALTQQPAASSSESSASSPMVTVQQEIDGPDGDAEEFESTAGLLPPAVAPPSVSGLWRSTGAVKDGLLPVLLLQRATLIHVVRRGVVAEEEFVKLEVSADGKVSGIIDSDGSGDWSEKDYKVEGGSFDTSTLELRFNQVHVRIKLNGENGASTLEWKARYDRETDSVVEGEWTVEGLLVGTFRMERTTEDAMPNRKRNSSEARPSTETLSPKPTGDSTMDEPDVEAVSSPKKKKSLGRRCMRMLFCG